MVTKAEIKEQWKRVQVARDELYGPLAAFEDECLKMDEMLGMRIEDEDEEEEPEEEAAPNPRRSGGGRGG